MLIYVSVLSQFYESEEFAVLKTLESGIKSLPRSMPNVLDAVPRESKSRERTIRGYAVRMLSLYDAVSKTEANSVVSQTRPPPMSSGGEKEGVQSVASVQSNKSSVEVSLHCISSDFAEEDALQSLRTPGSPISAHLVSKHNTDTHIRPYHRKMARKKHREIDSPPILVNMSHSTESVFSFEYEQSPEEQRRERSASTTLSPGDRQRKCFSPDSSKMWRRNHGVRRRSISNSPRLNTPKLTTQKTTGRHLSPSCSSAVDRVDLLSLSTVNEDKTGKATPSALD